MKKVVENIVALSVVVALIVTSFVFGRHFDKGSTKTEYDTIIIRDTFFASDPVASDSTFIGTEVATLPLVHKKNKSPDIIPNEDLPQEYLSEADTIDSATVVIPITQKVYKDTCYTVWVSGFKPNLDSIQVYQKTEIINITKWKQKRFSIGVTVGLTIGVDGKMQPGISIGGHYSFISF